MAIETRSIVANGAIAANTAVYVDASGLAVVATDPTVAGAKVFLGITGNTAAADGERVAVQCTGIGKAIAGEALTRGTHGLLMVGANGRLYAYDASAVNKYVAAWLPVEGRDAVAGDPIDVVVLGDIRTDNTVAVAAASVTYSNAVSGLAATDTQAAIDELAASGGGFVDLTVTLTDDPAQPSPFSITGGTAGKIVLITPKTGAIGAGNRLDPTSVTFAITTGTVHALLGDEAGGAAVNRAMVVLDGSGEAAGTITFSGTTTYSLYAEGFDFSAAGKVTDVSINAA